VYKRQVDADRNVINTNVTVAVNDVSVLVKPATKSCLSSGFGPRGSRFHKGVDYYSATGGEVLAAADGVIVEAEYREDYGYMLLIDHGLGVFTRYAHLAGFAGGIYEGAAVETGQVLGPIGSTGRSEAPHLHYEILVGNINNPRGSFGLQPVDPFNA